MDFVFLATGSNGEISNRGTRVVQDDLLCVHAVALRQPGVRKPRAWVGNQEEKVRGRTSRVDVHYGLRGPAYLFL